MVLDCTLMHGGVGHQSEPDSAEVEDEDKEIEEMQESGAEGPSELGEDLQMDSDQEAVGSDMDDSSDDDDDDGGGPGGG